MSHCHFSLPILWCNMDVTFGTACIFSLVHTLKIIIAPCVPWDAHCHCYCFVFLDKFQWSCPEWKGISGRYEHSAFIPDCSPKKVYVFGGAQQATNLNDVQALDLGSLQFFFMWWPLVLVVVAAKDFRSLDQEGWGREVTVPSPGLLMRPCQGKSRQATWPKT